MSNPAPGVIVNKMDISIRHFRETVKKAVCCGVVNPVLCASFNGQPQKKGLSPDQSLNRIKYVKGVSCVSQCLSVPIVHSASNVVKKLGVGGRLQKFWQKWLDMCANPRVVLILKEGYALPFKMRPPLTRIPLIQSGCANPVKKPCTKGGLVRSDKQVSGRKSVGPFLPSFLQPAGLGTKTQQQVAPHLGPKSAKSVPVVRYIQNGNSGNDKTITQQGEWVTSRDAYFHIPINHSSRST